MQRPTQTWRSWQSIKQRCKNSLPYVRKGITVCERWKSFENFLADVGEIPEGMRLDRIDNSKGYEPGNVRIATPAQQARNKTNNKLITINGVTKLAVEWAEEYGLSRSLLYNRIRYGWRGERLLIPADRIGNQPERRTPQRLVTINGVTKGLTEWARETGLTHATLRGRLCEGWPEEMLLAPPGSSRFRLPGYDPKRVRIGDRIQTIPQWSEESGISVGVIGDRLRKGWPEHLILKPTDPRIPGPNGHGPLPRKVTINGQSKTVKEWRTLQGLVVQPCRSASTRVGPNAFF